MTGPILERESELAVLAAVTEGAKAGEGSIVLIAGEAGIGKSTLIDALPAVLPAGTRLLVGYCDDLATPRVLGPLRDLIGSVGSVLTRVLQSSDHGQVSDALRAELNRPKQPTALVVEDVHWADEATLDVLRYLVRRVARLPAVLVLTYRDGELFSDHPLRQLLGLVASAPRLYRLWPARLSPDAVRRLGARTRMDAAQVFEATGGNPFFVVEVLASGDAGGVPHSVAEAVRGRLSNLSEATREVVEQLSVVPSAAEQWLVEALVPGGVAALADAEQRGVLTVAPTTVAFPHELARRAIMDSLPAARRIAYNQAVLAALLDHHGVDVSRIVHHGAEAGADGVIIEHGPAAARAAAAAGAHREAVAYYRLVLDRLSAFEPRERADLVEAYAIECYTAGYPERALPAQEDVVRRRREQGDPQALGRSLRWLSRMYWWTGARAAAEAHGAEAVAVLEPAGDEQALAFALCNQSQLHLLAGRNFDAVPLAQRAARMARALGDAALLSHALTNLGTAIWWSRGRTHLEESLQVALAAGETEPACRAYTNLATLLMDDLRLDEAERILEAAIELADDAEFLGFVRHLRVNLSVVHLMRGRWGRAESEAASLLETEPIVRCQALIVLGRVRVRSGRDGGAELLEQAWLAAQQLAEPQHICPAAAALLELAWLQDDLPRTASAMAEAYQQVQGLGRPPGLDEFEYWLAAAGLAVQVPVAESGCEPSSISGLPRGQATSTVTGRTEFGPYALLAAGAWREAADAWHGAGCPYESALASAHSSDAEDLLAALRTADGLGAVPLVRRLRQRLRELGVTRIPRGPLPTTRGNPAGLTSRQVDVVRLLADGLTNAEIAARLVLSVRTVDTHVAAALDKLGARGRRDAVARARERGLVESGGD